MQYRFPIENMSAGRQKEVFMCSENGIFLKNPVFQKNLCFRSMANWYKTAPVGYAKASAALEFET